MYVYIQTDRHTYIQVHVCLYIYIYMCVPEARFEAPPLHTCHILPPPLEIDLELCLAVFAGSGGNCLFHRIG